MSRNPRSLPRFVLATLLAALAVGTADAAQIGDRVAVIDDQSPILAGANTIDTVDRGEVFTVLNVKEQWLLVSRGHAGWLEAAHVLPIDQAVGVLNDVAAKQPNDPGVRVARARLWFETGHPDEAIAEAGEAIRLAPDLVAAWLIRSSAQRAKKDYAAALVDAQSALRLAPQSAEAHMAIGDVWLDQKRAEQAIVEYLAAVTIERKNCEFRLRLAQARLSSYDATQWSSAGQDFTTTIGLAENVPSCRRAARLGRAQAAAKEGRFRFALEEFKELAAEKPDDVQALIGRGRVQAELRRFEHAVPDLNEAVALAPHDAHVLIVRADIKVMQFNFRGATHDLDAAAKLDPKNAEGFYVRGKLLAKQKKWAPAIAAFTESIALDANNAEVYFARMEAYQAKGQTDLAKSDRAQVEKLSPAMLQPPTGRELMERQRRKMMDEFNNTAQSS